MADFEVLDVISTKGKKNNIRILKANISSKNEIVCLKTFKSHKFSVVQDALHEAKILMSASSHHQNICKMHDCFIEQLQDSFRFGIIMQHFDLGDLEDEIKRRKRANRPWNEDELSEVFIGLVDALSVLQKNQICHRDLKPQNIFMHSSNHFKIGDFGLSKKEGLGKLSLSKTLVGTPIYFSPICAKAYLQYELLGGDAKVNHNMYKSDVFSLGLTFLRMASLSSIRGLNCSTEEIIMQKINNLGYSEQVRGLLYHMLRLEENHRPDFIKLPFIHQELNSIMLSIQPDFIIPEDDISDIPEEIITESVEAEIEINSMNNCEDCKQDNEIWDLETIGSIEDDRSADIEADVDDNTNVDDNTSVDVVCTEGDCEDAVEVFNEIINNGELLLMTGDSNPDSDESIYILAYGVVNANDVSLEMLRGAPCTAQKMLILEPEGGRKISNLSKS